MKIEREAQLGLGVAVILGLIIGVPMYFLAGLQPGLSSLAQATDPSTDDVIEAFRDEGLEVGNSYNVEDDPEWGTGLLPKTMDSGTRFEIPGYQRAGGDEATGDVFHFATTQDQKVMSDYLDTVTKSSGLFYTHVYETDGFLLKIDGNVPKTVADRYGETFEDAT
ncbi:MAG: hypothetical protein H0T57_03215 [Rubrobacter sp.]|nr:hypothetical protein [Rubrobacter sp.]